MNVYKLSHRYSRLNSFYGVKTALSYYELNILCAYIQLLQYELSIPYGADDAIAEDNGAALLHAIFGLEVIREEEPYGLELDFYYNWDEYCCSRLEECLEEILAVAKPDAFRELLKNMADEWRDAIRRYNEGRFYLDSPDDWINEKEKNICRLQSVIDGGAVAPEWGWRTQDGSDSAGKVFVRNDGKPDFPTINLEN